MSRYRTTALAAAAALVLLHVGILVFRYGSQLASVWGDWIDTAAPVVAIVISWLKSRESGPFGKRVWRLVAFSAVLTSIGQGLYTEYFDYLHASLGTLWPSDVLVFFWVVPILLTLFLTPRDPGQKFGWLRACDFVQVCTLALAVELSQIYVPSRWQVAGQAMEVRALYAGIPFFGLAGQKVTLERIFDHKNRVVEELSLDQTGLARVLADGDVVNVFTLSPRLINAVTLRGNVATPLRFEWKEGLHIGDLIPDRSALVVPDYWLQRNRAGRPQSWIAESTEAKGDGAAKVTRDVKRPGAEVNWDYAVVERLNPVDYSTILIPFNLGAAIEDKGSEHNLKLEPGDIVTIFSRDDILGPQS